MQHPLSDSLRASLTRWAFVLVLGGAAFGGCLWLLFAPAWVWVNCTSGVTDPMEFRVRSGGVNSFYAIRFYSESRGEPLWDVRMRSLPGAGFTYGRLPPSASGGPVRQNFPRKGAAPRVPEPGERFIVEVDYQFDYLTAPCTDHEQFQFEVLSDRSVRALGKPSRQTWLPWLEEQAEDADTPEAKGHETR